MRVDARELAPSLLPSSHDGLQIVDLMETRRPSRSAVSIRRQVDRVKELLTRPLSHLYRCVQVAIKHQGNKHSH